ncbi:hypothetical protein SAMN05518865_1163 [Duganella sp. CF458]|nr:hypothetical protein SAMN05518865_1163 [Duganella sp. CF458]
MNADDLKVVLLRSQRAASIVQLLLPKVITNQHGRALLRQHTR